MTTRPSNSFRDGIKTIVGYKGQPTLNSDEKLPGTLTMQCCPTVVTGFPSSVDKADAFVMITDLTALNVSNICLLELQPCPSGLLIYKHMHESEEKTQMHLSKIPH